MFRTLFKKEKSRVFLGTLRIVPRDDFKRHFEIWEVEDRNKIALELYGYLEEFFQLPSASEVAEIRQTDLALDVTVLKYQLGQIVDSHLQTILCFLMWRPKIVIESKLYYLKTGKLKSSHKVTEKLSWKRFLSQPDPNPSWWISNLSLFNRALDEDHLKYLLYQASIKLMKKVMKST